MVKMIRQKLPASTIVETMVAMTVLLVVSGIAVTLFVQVNVAGNSVKRIKAAQMLDIFLMKTREEKDYKDVEITEGDYLLKRKVSAYGGRNGVQEIDYSIYDINNKKLLERKELLVAD